MIAEILNIIAPVPQQKSIARIYKPFLTNLLQTTFPMAEIRLSDPSYKLVDLTQMQKFLRRNGASERQYVSVSNDCDDFSFILMGDVTRWDPDLAFGVVWAYSLEGTYHALNILVDTVQQIWFVEPQTDEILSIEGWDVRFILM